MRDPTRWREEPSAPTQLLLRGARRPQPPGAHELERLGAAVDAIARAPSAPSPSWLRLGIAGVIAFLIAGGGTFVWALHARDVKRATEAAARAPSERTIAHAAATPRMQPIEAPEPEAASPVRSARPTRRHAVETKVVAAPAAPVESAKPTDTLAREVPLIDAGRSDLVAAPSRALASLEAHRREFPRGQLAAEREFLAVQALLQMNRMADAKKRAEELATHYPASSYAARAERLIEDTEAQRASVPKHDGSRDSYRPGQQRDQDRL